jgi:predicted aspartyl protease
MAVSVVALAALLLVAQPLAPTPAPVAEQPAATPAVASESGVASTALTLTPRDDRMTVPVTVNGAGPFPFIVDSGATRTVISRRLAALLSLPDAGTVALHSVGGESAVPSVRVAALAVGELPARPIVTPVLEEENLGALGILGIDMLAERKVVIDIAGRRMSVERADRVRPPAAEGEIVVEARRRYGQLVLADADAAGQKVWAIVDTGSMATIGNGVLRERLVRRRRAQPVETSLTDVAGLAIAATYAPITDLRLGSWHLTGTVIAFSDAHAFDRFGLARKPAMLLGMDLLRAFRRVTIDFGRRTVRLTRAGEDE